MKKGLKKVLKISGFSLACIAGVIAFVITLTSTIGAIAYNKFYSNSIKLFKIPGISEGYVAQGIEYLDDQKIYIMSSYNKNHNKASCLHVIANDGKTKKEVKLLNQDGSNYIKHCGGVEAYGNFVYVAGKSQFDVFRLDELLNANKGGAIKSIGAIDVHNNASFIYLDKDTNIIYSGEFEKEKSGYKTDSTHHLKTPCGDYNKALIIGYRVDESKEFGIDPVPVEAISIPSLAQGMCFTEKYAVMSTSWGISTSKFFYYDLSKMNVIGNINISGTEFNVPYYAFDSSNLVKVQKAPPMSEELEYVDGRLVYLTESASNKYIFGKWTGGYYARGLKVD